MANLEANINVLNLSFAESYIKDMDEAVTALQEADTKEKVNEAQNRIVHAQEKMRRKLFLESSK